MEIRETQCCKCGFYVKWMVAVQAHIVNMLEDCTRLGVDLSFVDWGVVAQHAVRSASYLQSRDWRSAAATGASMFQQLISCGSSWKTVRTEE